MSCLHRGLHYPVFREAVLWLHLCRLIWSVHPTLASQRGFWECNVLGKWRDTARKYAMRAHCVLRGEEYINRRYVETFRVDPALFDWLLELCEPCLTREDTNMRNNIAMDKRLGIVLHWLGHGFAERQLNCQSISYWCFNSKCHLA